MCASWKAPRLNSTTNPPEGGLSTPKKDCSKNTEVAVIVLRINRAKTEGLSYEEFS